MEAGIRSRGTESGQETHHGGIEAAGSSIALDPDRCMSNFIVMMIGVNTEILRSK